MQNQKPKFKTLIGLSLLTVGLAGCDPTVDGWQVIATQKFCEQHGGIDHMSTVYGVVATCRDGTIYTPKRGG